MTVTDEMIAAARRVLHADVDLSGWVDDDEIRAALEVALSAAPPSDDYRRGLEDAARVVRNWSMPTVQTPSMWLIDKVGIEADILALGVSK